MHKHIFLSTTNYKAYYTDPVEFVSFLNESG